MNDIMITWTWAEHNRHRVRMYEASNCNPACYVLGGEMPQMHTPDYGCICEQLIAEAWDNE